MHVIKKGYNPSDTLSFFLGGEQVCGLDDAKSGYFHDEFYPSGYETS